MMYTKRGPRATEEAAALAEARHPGVVQLVDAAGDVLRTRMVEGRSLSAIGPMPAAVVAGIGAAVAATLADLHDLGVVHGGIDASHVLVGTDGRPLLCSLGRGGDPADDVAALGRLITDLLADASPEEDARSWPRRSRRRRRLGPMLAPPVAPAMAALAAEAMVPDPSDRPTARAFADSIRGRIPSARLPGAALYRLPATPVMAGSRRSGAENSEMPTAPTDQATGLSRPGRWLARPVAGRHRRSGGKNRRIATGSATETRGRCRRGRSPALGAVAGGVVGLVAVLTVLAGVTVAGGWALSRDRGRAGLTGASEEGARPPKGQSRRSCAPACPSPAPPGPSPEHAPSRPAKTAPMATQVWPAEPLDVKDGVLNYRGSRYAVGHPGDSLVAGDWACTGERSLALLRRDAGEIFAFDGWPDNENVITARPVGQVTGAVDLRVVDVDGDGCHELEVEREGAPPVRLRVRS